MNQQDTICSDAERNLVRSEMLSLIGHRGISQDNIVHACQNVQTLANALELNGIAEVIERSKNDDIVRKRLINALTIHTTSWFRESSSLFQIIKYVKKNIEKSGEIKILSMACSTGQEVYSIALLLIEHFPKCKIEIQGTDVDEVSLETARNAVYKISELAQIPQNYHKYILVGSGPTDGLFTLDEEILNLCSFQVKNVLNLDLSTETYDLIFCRNVLIYFNEREISRVLTNVRKKLVDGSLLCLGISESIKYQDNNLKMLTPGIYTLPSSETLADAAHKFGQTSKIKESFSETVVVLMNENIDADMVKEKLGPNIIWVKPDSPLEAEASEYLLKNRLVVGFGSPNYHCMLFNELLISGPFHLIIIDSKPPVDFDRSHGEPEKKIGVEYFFLDEHVKVQRRISEIGSNTSKYTRPAKQQLKILFVDDEVDLCNLYSESLKISGFDVQICHDGSSAIELLKQKKFDLLVTDYSMPKVNGSILIRNAFQIQPSIKCILISGHLDEAADLGLEKPVIRINKPFSFQLLLTSCLRTLGTLIPKYDAKLIRASKPSLIAIGASTGGPNALNFLLKNLSGSSVPIVIVQHMSEFFHDQFYTDLIRLTKLQLKFVENSTSLLPGTIYAAAKNSHIEVIERQGVLIGRKGASLPVHGMCPAIDPLFTSLATNIKQTILAILMTGMGHDGADGLKLMKEAGHTTVIQDEASCVVYGMPKAAANINAALMEASLEQIKQILQVYCTYDNSPGSSR